MVMFWFWLFTSAVLIVLGLFIFTQGGEKLGPAIVTIGVVIVLFLLMTPVRAHDHARPALTDWLKGLHNKSKALCCDGNDTDAIEDWETKDNRYRVKFRGQWFDVPDEAIVEDQNKAGDALLWMNKGFSGFSVRCFMPGSMT